MNEKFYYGVRAFGSDCTMISYMFPLYTQKHIKKKMEAEERKNKAKMDWAHKNRINLSLEEKEKILGSVLGKRKVESDRYYGKAPFPISYETELKPETMKMEILTKCEAESDNEKNDDSVKKNQQDNGNNGNNDDNDDNGNNDNEGLKSKVASEKCLDIAEKCLSGPQPSLEDNQEFTPKFDGKRRKRLLKIQ
jgi:hypothetical protein